MGVCGMSAVTFPSGTLGHAAEAYASLGFAVFPLWHTRFGACDCPRGAGCTRPGKHPRTRHGLDEATADMDTVRAWWVRWPLANIGVPAGANGLAVIDIDPAHGGNESLALLDEYCQRRGVDLMRTRTVRTGSGGLHLYYRQPARGIKTCAETFGAPGVDTRGRGGYVVAPPSMHACGGVYALVSEPSVGLAPWPTVLNPLMEREETAPAGVVVRATGHRGEAWARAGLQRDCADLATLPRGRRNDTLNAVAYKHARRVAAGMLDVDEVREALVEASNAWVGDECSAAENLDTINSGIRGGMRAGAQR